MAEAAAAAKAAVAVAAAAAAAERDAHVPPSPHLPLSEALVEGDTAEPVYH